MAKFIKSLFNPTEKKYSKSDFEDNRDDFTPPLDGRRKLSISRSGRMKQANKKRVSLTLDAYGENFQLPEKPSAKEYHVHSLSFTKSVAMATNEKKNTNTTKKEQGDQKVPEKEHELTPEEEIDSAFEIIDAEQL